MNDLIRINYDDYYKFLVSTGIVGVILLFVAALYLNSKSESVLAPPVLYVVGVPLVIFLAMIVIGLYFWQHRQKRHDTLLEYEVNMRKLEIDEKNLLVKKLSIQVRDEELNQKSAELRIREYEGQNIFKKVD